MSKLCVKVSTKICLHSSIKWPRPAEIVHPNHYNPLFFNIYILSIIQNSLVAAAARTAEVIPVRDCFLLAKDGKIMYEEYYRDNGPETVYESDSMTKTATALLIGVLVQHG